MKYLQRVEVVTMVNRIRNEKQREEPESKPVLEYIEEKQSSFCGDSYEEQTKNKIGSYKMRETERGVELLVT